MSSLYGCQKAEGEERGDRVLYDCTKTSRTYEVLQYTYPSPYARFLRLLALMPLANLHFFNLASLVFNLTPFC